MPMVKRWCAVFMLVVFSWSFQSTAQAFDEKPALQSLREDLAQGDAIRVAERTDHAIDAMIKVAGIKLRRMGDRRLAESIEHDWRQHFEGHLISFVSGAEDLGDHAAWSFWIEAVYLILEAKLGTVTMQLLHLDDLHTVNLAVPVTLHLAIIGDDPIDVTEYGKHFEPLAGVLAYWGTFLACEIVTYSTGIFLICAPAGMAAELITVNFIAPYFTPTLYERFYPARGAPVPLMSCHCDCEGCTCGDDCDCEDCDCGNLTEGAEYDDVLSAL